MKLKELSKQELEAMSYDDIAFLILTESKNPMKINEIFKQVCDLLELPESVFLDKIAGFFEVLSTDQRFTMLKDGLWDLKAKHTGTKIVIDEEDDEDVLAEALDEEEDEFEEEEEEDIYNENDETEDLGEDDLKDLVIIDEDEEANGLS